mgnify:CR=1 FL=1
MSKGGIGQNILREMNEDFHEEIPVPKIKELLNEVKTKMSKKMTYEEWYNKNEEEIWIELAEIGADREMDFNSEVEFNNRYEDYLNQNEDEKISR